MESRCQAINDDGTENDKGRQKRIHKILNIILNLILTRVWNREDGKKLISLLYC